MISVGNSEIEKPATVHVFAKQFGWEFQYPGKDNRFGTLDDFVVENILVVPEDETTVLRLESRDVIHSFFVPKLRLKHDVVPGMIQMAWFEPTGVANVNILCAELCGWGHYKMNAELRIVNRNDYQTWIDEQIQRVAAPELAPFSKTGP